MKFTVTYFAAFFAVLLVLKFLLLVSEPYLWTNNTWIKSRIRQSLRALDERLQRPGMVRIFLGTSEAEIGFNPLIFDQTLGLDTGTLNLAARNVGSVLPLYLARIGKELKRHSTAADVLFLHVPVSRLTRRARNSAIEGNKTHDLPTVYFDYSLVGSFAASYSELAFLFFNKYFLGERTLSQFTYFFRRPIRSWMTEQSLVASARSDLWNRTDLHTEPAWDPKTRGHFYWNVDDQGANLRGLLQAAPSESALRSSINFQRSCCDFVDLDIDWEYVRQVRGSLKKLKKVSRRLILVDLPEHPDFIRSPQSQANMNEVYRRLSEGTGVDLWRPKMTTPYMAADFIDVVHFSPAGVRKFSEDLARTTRNLWQN